MKRVLRNRLEMEGEIIERLTLVDGEDLPAWAVDRAFTAVGIATQRVDAFAKVTGAARYTQDIVPVGTLHARFVRSPWPHARVRSVDAKRALALPGVHSVLHRFNAPKTPYRGEDTIFSEKVRFVGDEVAVVVAESDEIASTALELIEVGYEVLPFVAELEDAIADETNVSVADQYARGDAESALRESEVTIEATYRTSTQMHNSLETHSAVASWDGDRLTVWESTQHLFGVRQDLCASLGLPYSKVRVLCDYIGGGFGSKGAAGKYTIAAAVLSMRLGAPVRCVFTREEENLAAGNRPATVQRFRVGWKANRIHAIEHVSWSDYGQGYRGPTPIGPTNSLYTIANVSSRAHRVGTNMGAYSAFRGPAYVEGTFALESAIDELAAAAGVDPLDIRKSHGGAVNDPMTGEPYSAKHLLECYEIGAQEIGWSKRRAEGSRGSAPHRRRGFGMASQIWGGGGGPPAYATVHVNPDGTAIVRVGTQDLGTGTRTVMAQICAEELGLEVGAVHVDIGDTDSPYAPRSAGSRTVASVGPAVRRAAADAHAQLLEVVAGLLETPAAELRIERGQVLGASGQTPLSKLLGQLRNDTVIGRGSRFMNPEGRSLKTFGAQFAHVEVDIRTGEIFPLHIVAVHDIGRIVNPLTARSQMEGGILQGLGYALSERRVIDRATGRMVNADLEGYKVPTVRDVPKITARFIDRPDDVANDIGSKGVGEPSIIPTAAAIANAVANALGVRIRTIPLTPARVLDAITAAERTR